MLEKNLESLLQEAETGISQASDQKVLDQVRVSYLGKSGHITELLKSIQQLPPKERPQMGQEINAVKQALIKLINQKKQSLEDAELSEKLNTETIDITLPGRRQSLGFLHPVTQMRNRAERLLSDMGFSTVEGPEIEDDHHNFTALNIPDHHPARALHDTFYFSDGYLLRTHTSPVQIRVMETTPPPLKIITPGKVYRCDSDQTHTPMFHQLEGLCVNEDCSFAHLKDVIVDFLNAFFETKLDLRFRPSYFPFTEPSAEVDIKGDNGWLEVLGCGMVHPNVLDNVGIDTETYSGFAFGIGLDRLAMLYYKINDLRLFFENDLRFLEQF